MRWKKAALENCAGVPCLTTAVPGAPTAVVATASIESASVAFEAPSNTGGIAITGYTVTSNPGNITASGPTSPIIVKGLMNGQIYTFTVVATNVVGNSLASTASAGVTPAAPSSCPTLTITDVDGNIYNTVSIGTQCWTKQNLKVSKYNDMTAIPLDASAADGSSGSWPAWQSGAYTIYGNESSASTNATNYGFLYNWYAAAGINTHMGSPTKNICPTGWHVPTDSDWNILVKSMHSGADTSSTGPSATQSNTAGGYMKSTGNITLGTGLWTSPNTGADNSSFFTALPGGRRNDDGSFRDIRDNAHLWVATHYGILTGNGAYIRILYYYNSTLQKATENKWLGASVRCLRD